MRTVKIASVGLFFLCIALACIPSSSNGSELKTFPVGAFLPVTGPMAIHGRMISQGARTAIDEINAAEGIEHYKLNLIMIDFREVNIELAVNGVRKMISIDKTPFLLGSFGGPILATQPIAAENHVLIVNGGGSSPALANKPYLHNLRMHLGLVIPHGLKYMWNQGYRKLAILSYNDPSGTVTRDEVVIPLWTKWGGKIVANEMNEVTTIDFSAQVSRIKAAAPDLVLNLQAGELSGYAVKGLREMGLKCPILNNEWSPAAQKVLGVELSKNVFVSVELFDRTDPHPLTQRFVKSYEKKWGEEPDFFGAANYYDAVYVLAELIKRVVSKGGNPLDGAQLEAAFWDNQIFPSVYGGKMKLMKDGTVRKPTSLFQIIDGKLVLIERFKAED
jgi:branched-chain amino acid transport system substrate-binding protein